MPLVPGAYNAGTTTVINYVVLTRLFSGRRVFKKANKLPSFNPCPDRNSLIRTPILSTKIIEGMKKLETLEQIRAKFANKQEAQPIAHPCPKCGKSLTIERTQFFESEICEHCLDHAKINEINVCCDLPDPKPVKLITSAGTIQVRNQCQNCGDVSPNSLGGYSKEQREALPVVDQHRREERQSKWGDLIKEFWDKVSAKRANKQAQGKEQWMQAYNAYLNSPEWKVKRLGVLKRDNYLCQCCLNAYATQVHHKSYQFVDLKGNEPAFDLVAICVPCHEKVEEMKRQQRNP